MLRYIHTVKVGYINRKRELLRCTIFSRYDVQEKVVKPDAEADSVLPFARVSKQQSALEAEL
mgnify:CR=1 FL=1